MASGTDELPGVVLVTGAAGYLGRHVVRALLDRGAHVVAVDRSATSASSRVDPRATIVAVDIFDEDAATYEALHSPDSRRAPRLGGRLQPRVPGAHRSTLRPLSVRAPDGRGRGDPDRRRRDDARDRLPRGSRSTASTPTRPQNLYGIAKNALRGALEVELRCGPSPCSGCAASTSWATTRRTTRSSPRSLEAAARGDRTFPFTSGTHEFDFIEITELAAQIATTALQAEETGIINCCSGTPQSLGSRAEAFIRDRGFDITLEYGAYPDRPFESPALWGDATVIRRIMDRAASRGPRL